MNTTEKFQKLVSVATENGWCNWLPKDYEIDTNHCVAYPSKIDTGIDAIIMATENTNDVEYSINDIILNYEDNETSFIEALCKNVKNTFVTNTNTIVSSNVSESNLHKTYFPVANLQQYYMFSWASLPTSQRLNWLFDTFKHLL
jgi:hypothetical protein